jgi:Fe-S-cluster containining protein
MPNINATDHDEFDPSKLPANPFLMESFLEFIRRQKEATKIHKGKPVKCIGCGDCCTYNYYKMQVSPQLVKDLRAKKKYPHGHWVLANRAMHLFLTFWDGDDDEPVRTMRFTGPIGADYYEFHKVSGRRDGYWVLNEDGWICCYSPDKCQHLTDDMKCEVYATRPKICRGYYCGRYLVNPDDDK